MARRGRKAEPPAAPARVPAPEARALGVALAAVLALAGAAGVVLAFRYDPSPARAHAALLAIEAGPLRWVRSLHAWGASAAVAVGLLLLARGWAADRFGAMGRRRALAALLLFAVLLGAYVTGTMLPWDQRAWEAYEHAQDGAALVGVPLGVEEEPLAAPLGVVFWAHVLAVPALLAIGLAFHLPARERALATLRAHPRLVGGVVLGVVVLALLAPPMLGPAPIPLLEVSRPHWPFLWLVPLQDAFGAPALLALPLAFALVAAAVLLPPPRRRGLVLAAVAAVFGVLTVLGAR